jgi:DNA helicase-2/ATP-dependent DNA helicase PcrA
MSPAEREERERLDACQARIRDALRQIGARLGEQAREVKSGNAYMWEARRDMDHIEKIAVRQGIEQTMRSGDALEAQQKKLAKLVRSPYFGRVDFERGAQHRASTEAIYVGVHHFRDEATGETLVYDWRAPIANLFYDHEIGPASYVAPAGEISGELRLKRQFRIREGQMEFMLESALHVVDDILQHELSRAADAGMRNIVATIQRDQNTIIRNEEAHTLVIQGVAGSGKTSIALHRIAFLLYRFKDKLSSEDILIVSPNRVFADYIGNVLPELGEEQVSEIGMDSLADELLGSQYRFETFFEQTARLLEIESDEALEQRIAAKSSLDFLQTIDVYAEHLEASSFEAREWRLGRKIVPGWHFDETWRKHRGLPLTERIARVVSATEQQIGIHYHHKLETEERGALREAVRSMAYCVLGDGMLPLSFPALQGEQHRARHFLLAAFVVGHHPAGQTECTGSLGEAELVPPAPTNEFGDIGTAVLLERHFVEPVSAHVKIARPHEAEPVLADIDTREHGRIAQGPQALEALHEIAQVHRERLAIHESDGKRVVAHGLHARDANRFGFTHGLLSSE